MGDKKTILIKRYASRRLYNTETSEYVTLAEITKLIQSGRDVQIVDSKTGEDLTTQMLLRIIAENDSGGEQALPQNFLMDMIRSYQDNAGTMMPEFLSRSYDIFKEQQAEFLKHQKQIMSDMSDTAKDMMGVKPKAPPSMMEMGPEIMKAWQERMGRWLGKGLTGNIAEGMAAGSMEAMIENSMKSFEKFNPLANMDMSNFDLDSMREQQAKYFSKVMEAWMPNSDKSDPEQKAEPAKETPKSGYTEAELDDMRRQLAELQAKLEK